MPNSRVVDHNELGSTPQSAVVQMGDGDTLHILQNAGVFAYDANSQSGSGTVGVGLTTNSTAQIDGSVFSASLTAVTATSNNEITIGETGSVLSASYDSFRLYQNGNTVTNHGDIQTIRGFGFYVNGTNNFIDNYGTIKTGSNLCVYFEYKLAAAGVNTLHNSGTIEGGSSWAVWALGDMELTNGGVIAANNGVTAYGALDMTNTGQIIGRSGTGVNARGATTLTNDGLISSTTGVAVTFGDAADLYDGRNGTLQGSVVAGGGADSLYGGAGAEKFDGGADNDTIDGGAGADTMIGGTGADVYFVDSLGDFVDESGGVAGEIDLVMTSAVSIDLTNAARFSGEVENVTLGGSLALNVTGNALANALVGNSGMNKIDGGVGADTMTGGAGNDTYYVDDVGDKVVELAGQGTDFVHTTLASYTLTANVERLYFDNDIAHTGRGNGLANLIYGGAGSDKFIIDAGGADTFSGGAGDDSFDGRSSASAMTLRLDNQSLNAGSIAGDTFASIEKFFGSDTAGDRMTTGAARAKFYGYGGNDTLTGGSSVDALSGGAGNDSLVGNGGQDALDGGAGDDTMTGGAGADVFTFVDAAFGKDTVTDFQDGSDRLKIFSAIADDISDFTIAGNGTTHVVLTLAAAPANTITLDSASNVTITASDFLFY